MKNIKNWVLILLFTFLLSGCDKPDPVPQENPPSVSEEQESNESDESNVFIDFSQEELDLLRINIGQSNYDNSINLKGRIPGKMCYVPETDTLFYSDSSGLYQKNGESVIKLLDESVISINIADGKLYFILPIGENRYGSYGKLYQMDLSSGVTDCVIEEEIGNASVYKDRIFYLKHEIIELEEGAYAIKKSYFKCDLSGSNSEEISDKSFFFGDDICVFYTDHAIQALDLSTNEVTGLAEESEAATDLSVYRGCVYYTRNIAGVVDTAVKIDLTDGSVTELKAKGAYFEDYGFVDGKLCLYDTVFYLAEGENLVKYECSQTYRGIYTCGDKMYGLKPGGKLCELYFDSGHGYGFVTETEIGGSKNEA